MFTAFVSTAQGHVTEMDIERRFYHYGLGAGIPYRALNSVADAVDLARNARDVGRRKKAARAITEGSSWSGFISQDSGFATVAPDTLPGTREAIEAALAVIEDRRVSGWKSRATIRSTNASVRRDSSGTRP